VRAAAVFLVALLVAAALHELAFILLGQEHGHDHANCPLCLLNHAPMLFSVCFIALGALLSGCSNPRPTHEVPIDSRFPVRLIPRAPPVR